MTTMALSVIIPTRNRQALLARCLDALCRQERCPDPFEVIVVDDGSTDKTAEMISARQGVSPFVLRYIMRDHRGPAAARNEGMARASGERILFLGDDIIADAGLLAQHMAWHDRYPDERAGVLGYITWSRETAVTPFMWWLEHGGIQFAYGDLEEKIEIDTAGYFYSSNISWKRHFLVSNSCFFDEAFPGAAYEDLELGHRVARCGGKLYFNRAAIGYHSHYTSLADACRRMVLVGRSSRVYAEKTGRRVSYIPRSLIRSWLAHAKFMAYYTAGLFYERRAVNERVFRYLMEYCYRRGASQ